MAYPHAAQDFLATFAALGKDKSLGQLVDAEVPMRLTFLTPAGKRVLEGTTRRPPASGLPIVRLWCV